MPKVELIVKRYYAPYSFFFDTFKEAALEALNQLDHDQSFPSKILMDEQVVWEQDGPLGPALEFLETFRGG